MADSPVSLLPAHFTPSLWKPAGQSPILKAQATLLSFAEYDNGNAVAQTGRLRTAESAIVFCKAQ